VITEKDLINYLETYQSEIENEHKNHEEAKCLGCNVINSFLKVEDKFDIVFDNALVLICLGGLTPVEVMKNIFTLGIACGYEIRDKQILEEMLK
jgi:hypothetical protein